MFDSVKQDLFTFKGLVLTLVHIALIVGAGTMVTYASNMWHYGTPTGFGVQQPAASSKR